MIWYDMIWYIPYSERKVGRNSNKNKTEAKKEREREVHVRVSRRYHIYMTCQDEGTRSEPSCRSPSPSTGTRGFPTTTTGTQVHHLLQQCRMYLHTQKTKKNWHHNSNNDTSAWKKTKRSPEKSESLELALDLPEGTTHPCADLRHQNAYTQPKAST